MAPEKTASNWQIVRVFGNFYNPLANVVLPRPVFRKMFIFSFEDRSFVMAYSRTDSRHRLSWFIGRLQVLAP